MRHVGEKFILNFFRFAQLLVRFLQQPGTDRNFLFHASALSYIFQEPDKKVFPVCMGMRQGELDKKFLTVLSDSGDLCCLIHERSFSCCKKFSDPLQMSIMVPMGNYGLTQ